MVFDAQNGLRFNDLNNGLRKLPDSLQKTWRAIRRSDDPIWHVTWITAWRYGITIFGREAEILEIH